MGRLDGKVAIITGGASGIGLASAERFAAEGAEVVIVDLPATAGADLAARLGQAASLHYGDRPVGGPNDGAAVADRLGDAVRFAAADVTVADQLRAAFDAAVSEFGGLDIVFNNAGVSGIEGSIAECPEQLFDRTIDIDLKGVWRGIQYAVPHLIERGGGSIISTGSVAGLRGVPGMGSYSAAKGAVIALTRVAAMELAQHKIRVNCICPGAIVTPLLYESPAMGFSLDPDVVRPGLAAAQPLPQSGEAEDIASAALFLASDESSFITGQIWAVDGGLTAEADARNRTQAVADSLGLLDG